MSRFLAIDIDAAGLFVAAGTARGGAARVEQAAAWTEDVPPFSAETAAAYGERLKGLLKAANIGSAPAVVGIGRDKVILKELRFPPVEPTEEPNIVRFQALKEVAEAADEVVLDYVPLSHPDPAERRATAVVVRRGVYLAAKLMCEAAGLKLAAVTPRPFAVGAGLRHAVAGGAAVPPENPDGAAAVFTSGPGGGEFTVVRGGEVLFSRSVPQPAFASETALVGELKRNLTVYAGQHPGEPVRAVYAAEADAPGAGWAGRLRAGLPVPVHAYDPLAGVAPGVKAADRGRFGGAVALLAAKAAPAGLPINLASPRQPTAAADPFRRKLLFAAAAAGLLLAVGGALGMMEVSKARAQVTLLQAEKQRLTDQKGREELSAKKVRLVEAWEGRQVVWLDELYDLADRFPKYEETRVSSITGTVLPLDKAGKQAANGKLEVKLATRDPQAVTDLVSAIDRDNVEKGKYYVGAQKKTGGLASGGGTPFSQLFTVETLVNHRPPAEYTRQSAVAAPAPPAKKEAPKKASDDWFDN